MRYARSVRNIVTLWIRMLQKNRVHPAARECYATDENFQEEAYINKLVIRRPGSATERCFRDLLMLEDR